jgi:hypothetical protein
MSFIVRAADDSVGASAQPSGLWVMLDHNNQKAERIKAKQLAEARGAQLKVFSTVEDWKKWLAQDKNSQTEVDTLIVSGHAMGSAFDRGLSVNALAEIARENSGVSKTKALYALGCYTATTANARLWARTLPDLRYVAGFDESAPSHDPAVQFLEEMERVRPQLGPQRTPEELKRDLERAFVYINSKGQWSTNAAVGVLDRSGQKMNFVSRRKGTSVLPFGPPDIEGCKKTISNLETSLKPAKSIQNYLALNYNGGSPPNCASIKNLPAAGDHSGDLRKIYSMMQRMALCDKEVFLMDPSLVKRVELILDAKTLPREGAYAMDASYDEIRENLMASAFEERRDQMIVFIHQEQILKNFMECAQPFLRAVADRAKSCLKDRDAVPLINAIQKTPVSRQSVCEMWKALEAHADFVSLAQDMSSGLLENKSPWALRDMELWSPLNPSNRSKVCGRLTLNKREILKALQDRQKPAKKQASFGRCRALNSIIGDKHMVGRLSADGRDIDGWVETPVDWSEAHVPNDVFWGVDESFFQHEGSSFPGGDSH